MVYLSIKAHNNYENLIITDDIIKNIKYQWFNNFVYKYKWKQYILEFQGRVNQLRRY